MTTDTSEKGLETIIMRDMTGTDGLAVTPNLQAEPPASYGGTGYFAGSPQDYDRAHALDVPQLFAFLSATQPEEFKKLALAHVNDPKRKPPQVPRPSHRDRQTRRHRCAPQRRRPRAGSLRSVLRHALGRATLPPRRSTLEPFLDHRQLAYSADETRRALDLCLFIGGLPIAAFD
jgi:type I restriction enzyme R subunit